MREKRAFREMEQKRSNPLRELWNETTKTEKAMLFALIGVALYSAKVTGNEMGLSMDDASYKSFANALNEKRAELEKAVGEFQETKEGKEHQVVGEYMTLFEKTPAISVF